MVRHPMRALAACGVILLALISGPWSGYAQAETPAAGGREPATVKLSATQQKQIGLQTAVLAAESHPEQIRAYGTVLDVARLTELTNNYANAQAQLQTAQARLEVARLAYERARDLVQSAAMPKKDAEAAEGTFRTDQAALAAADSQVKTLMATARQEWGAVIGRGIIERSPQVVQLIEREQLLVQVTLPPGVTLAEPPRFALAQAPTRSVNIDLRYLSPATRTDPRIQGVSYYFVAGGDSGLLPGMNTTAYVPSGKSYDGVFVEDTAIVQWQGRAWVYLRAGPETFKRHPIRTDQPVSDDDYVVQDIPPGSELVMRGAQVLLSEEAKSELRGGGDDD
ncbi:putative Multidrug resistant protein [Bradyrhizobium sp. ORS 285]|uniref:hypothetical protein n=1 Tax=Bradyrhizobium sp. ORS 285 TaxID=115808 RepID=UPI0002408417|nr:putative Multidrug resistant protein [Bradyrhizobium sp. ORS 285]SMX60998.1 putative Multidrug resistant protein [Bradyrhizobium sp. ORS 285]